MDFLGAHILSIDQFTLEDIEKIFLVARTMEPYAAGTKCTRVLEGAIMANLFFEPSTRSRVSFGAAFNRLGGHVRDTTGIESSSIVKGESLWDTARVISGYVDTIVVRHPQVGAVAEFSGGSLVPVISGGDGAGEHPTQALLDLYTIHKELGKELRALSGARIAIVGDLKNGRAVHSLVKILTLLPQLQLTFVFPAALCLPPELLELAASRGHIVSEERSVESGIAGADVVYVTRLQRERFSSPEEAAAHVGSYRLDAQVWRGRCSPSAIIMHPLPRDSRPEAGELGNDLNNEPGLAIFRQTRNGIPIRMALFALALGVEKSVTDFEEKVRWRRAGYSAD
jgi:aspartate carbamoyltransferase catalytic subunit